MDTWGMNLVAASKRSGTVLELIRFVCRDSPLANRVRIGQGEHT